MDDSQVQLLEQADQPYRTVRVKPEPIFLSEWTSGIREYYHNTGIREYYHNK